MLVRGEFDVSFESAAQVDRRGNLNITRIGSAEHPQVRLVGCLAQPEHLAFVRRPIIVADLSPRVFVEAVDHVTSFGFGPGPGTRSSLGYDGGGPALVVTDHCVFDFTPDGEMRLLALYPGVSLGAVLERMSFEPVMPSELVECPEPSPEDLGAIREQIDATGTLLRV